MKPDYSFWLLPVLKDFGVYGELFRRGCVTQAPTAHVGQQGHQSDGCVGQAVNDLLLALGRIVATDTNPAFSRRVSRSARMFEAIRSSDRVSNSRK